MLKGLLNHKSKTGNNRETNYHFILGKMLYNGTIEPFQQSVSYRKGNRVLIFPNKSRLEDFLAKKHENDRHFKQQREKNVDELYILDTMPHPRLFHVNVYAYALIDEIKIRRLIEEKRQQLIDTTGTLPDVPVCIPYDCRLGDYVAVLEVQFHD